MTSHRRTDDAYRIPTSTADCYSPSAVSRVLFLTSNRIHELLMPFLASPLPAVQLEQISTYIDLILRWNARINLTAVRDPEQIVTRHFGESFFLARHLLPPESAAHTERVRVLDIGSGAGFPGLPMKIWAPSISLALLEANQKKATFLREATRALTLTDVNVISERAESLLSPRTRVAPVPCSDHQSHRDYDIATIRAVERFNDLLPIAARLVRSGGRLTLLIGVSQLSILPAITPDMRWQDPIAVPQSQARVLSIGVRTL